MRPVVVVVLAPVVDDAAHVGHTGNQRHGLLVIGSATSGSQSAAPNGGLQMVNVPRRTLGMVSKRVVGLLATAMVGGIGSAHAQPASLAAQSAVEWKVRESFPLLPLNKVEALRDAKLTSATEVYRKLEADWKVGSPIVADVTDTQYDRERGRYKPGYLLQHGAPVTVSARVIGASSEVARSQCVWSVRSAGGQDAQPTTAVAQQCSQWVDLMVPLGVKIKLQARIAGDEGAAAAEMTTQTATQPLEEDVTVIQRVTVALGDSYAAGQGNPDVPAENARFTNPKPGPDWPFRAREQRGAKAVWWDDECQRSLLSWPVLTVLTQAITDEDRKTRHVLLTYACSGAEVVDGGFLAQIKSSVRGRTYSPNRDGEVDDMNVEQQALSWKVKRSQINAMYDDLCFQQERIAKMVNVPARPVTRAWTYGCVNPMPVDRLLLSMGGNDLGFPNIAMGIFLPDEANHWYGRLPLWLFRAFVKAEDPNRVANRVAKYGKIYPKAIQALREATGVPASKTVLVMYPNPVVSAGPTGMDDAPSNGCTGGHVVATVGGKKVTSQQARVRDINLVLGWALASSIPIFDIGSTWVLSAEENEVKGFKTIYKYISQMQGEALDFGDADQGHMEGATYGSEELFKGRRLCDRVETANDVYLPMHMCSSYPGQCNAGAAMGGGQWMPRGPAEYKHYAGLQEEIKDGKTVKQPRRPIVYSLNESVLAQRSWKEHDEPSGEQIRDALSGAMHPSAEAYAAAADSILKAIERSRQKRAARTPLEGRQ